MKAFAFPKKKRIYNEAFYKTTDFTKLTYKILKLNIDKKDITSMISNIKLEENKIKEIYKNEYLLTLILAKILTKLNYCYERYITFHKDKNDKKKQKYEDNTKYVKSDKLEIEKIKNIFQIHNNSDNNNEDKAPTNNNNSHIPSLNSKSYINSELYPLVRNFNNINPNNLEIINIIGDGNCMFRAISHYIYHNEENYPIIRKEIYETALLKKHLIPNIYIDSERGRMKIHEYIDTIQYDRNFGGDLEMSLAYEIYKCNIAVYNASQDITGKINNLTFLDYINNDNNEKKFIILIYINNIHYNVEYYNNTVLDFNYSPDKILNKNDNKKDINYKEKDNYFNEGILNKFNDDITAEDIMIFKKFDKLLYGGNKEMDYYLIFSID